MIFTKQVLITYSIATLHNIWIDMKLIIFECSIRLDTVIVVFYFTSPGTVTNSFLEAYRVKHNFMTPLNDAFFNLWLFSRLNRNVILSPLMQPQILLSRLSICMESIFPQFKPQVSPLVRTIAYLFTFYITTVNAFIIRRTHPTPLQTKFWIH